MTKVQIFKSKNGTIRSFRCSGHAGFAEAGEDIVCAAISILVINTINCLDELLGEKIRTASDEKRGIIECTFQEVPSEKASFLVDCMVLGLRDIRRNYGDRYLTYEMKEV